MSSEKIDMITFNMSSEKIDMIMFASFWVVTVILLLIMLNAWNQETKDVCEYLCSTYYTNTEDYKNCKEKPLIEIVKGLPKEVK